MSGEDRLRELWDLHASAVAAYFDRRYRGADVEDLVAEVFLVAWRRAGVIPVGRELPWLYGVAAKVLGHRRRDDRAETRRVNAVVAAARGTRQATNPGDSTSEVIDSIDLRNALSDLRPAYREVLLLAGWEGLSGAALATALGCSSAAARVRLHRARRALAGALTPAAADPPDAMTAGPRLTTLKGNRR